MMRFLHWRVILGLFWLAMSLVLFFREELFPEALLAQYRGRNLSFGAWFGLALAGWNLARWYQNETIRLQRAMPVRRPLQPRTEADAGYEYNPEFDFQKQEPEASESPPSRNGDGH
jgi:hypothetical protein